MLLCVRAECRKRECKKGQRIVHIIFCLFVVGSMMLRWCGIRGLCCLCVLSVFAGLLQIVQSIISPASQRNILKLSSICPYVVITVSVHSLLKYLYSLQHFVRIFIAL